MIGHATLRVRPFEIGVEPAGALRPFTPWHEPLDLCCLVAVHNFEACYNHHWPLACRVVTRLDPDYWTDDAIADRAYWRENAAEWDW